MEVGQRLVAESELQAKFHTTPGTSGTCSTRTWPTCSCRSASSASSSISGSASFNFSFPSSSSPSSSPSSSSSSTSSDRATAAAVTGGRAWRPASPPSTPATCPTSPWSATTTWAPPGRWSGPGSRRWRRQAGARGGGGGQGRVGGGAGAAVRQGRRPAPGETRGQPWTQALRPSGLDSYTQFCLDLFTKPWKCRIGVQ